MVPLGDRVLVKLRDPEKQSKGGILLPDQAKNKSHVGSVLAIGDSVSLVAKGDTVYFVPYTGNQVGPDDTVLALREEDILCIGE